MDWLDYIFEGASLFESGIWFIGGLVLCLVGGIMLWEAIAFRLRAYKVDVLILGVIPNTTNKKINRVFHPVYEFTTRDGELIRMKNQKAKSVVDHLPNTRRTFLVDPENKYDLRSTKPWLILLGILLFIWGLGLFKIASVTSRSLMWAGLMALVIILGWIAKNIVSSLSDVTTKSPQPATRPPATPLRIRSGVKKPDKFELSEIMTERQQWEEIRKTDRSTLMWMPLFLLLSIAAVAYGGYRGLQRGALTFFGQGTTGKVVSIESKSGTDSTSHYSIVEFSDADGKKHKVRDNIGSSTPMDNRGDEVAVIFDPSDPERALIDRGFWSWLLPGGFTGGGLLILYAYSGFLIHYFKRRQMAKEVLQA